MAWLTIALLAAGATRFPVLWSLDTELVRQGEWWRLISCQLVHLTWQHYCYDLFTLGLVLWLCLRMTSGLREIVWVALCSSVTVTMTIQMLHPVDVYGGVSGIIAGLLAWSTLTLIRHGSQMVGGAVLVGMLYKIYLEWKGVSVSGVDAVWQAHCAGALAGALCGTDFKTPTLSVRMLKGTRSTS
jgi:rhomboid family GlyGly-CTERM serine protease